MTMESHKEKKLTIPERIVQILDEELPEIDARIVYQESLIHRGTETEEELKARKDLLEFFKKRKREVEAELTILSK